MSPSKAFCVECGREDVALDRGMCSACIVRMRPLASLPDHFEVELCAHCGSRRRGANWEDFLGTPESAFEEAAREALSIVPEVEAARSDFRVRAEDPHQFAIAVVVEGRVGSAPVRLVKSARGQLKRGTCLRCSRIFGGYFEAIVQIRSEGTLTGQARGRAIAILERELTRMQEKGNREAYVAESREERGGPDFYLGSVQAARAITRVLAHELHATTNESPKLVGRRDGRDMYRVTIAVRLPNYAPGDFLAFADSVHRVQGMDAKTVTLLDLRTGRTSVLERERARPAERVGREAIESAVVVSDSGSGLQILDPQTMETVDVARPAGLVASGEVRVLRVGGELFVLAE